MAPLVFDVDVERIPVDITPNRPVYVGQLEQGLTSSEKLVNFMKENNLSSESKQQKEPWEVEITKERAEYEKTATEQAKAIVRSAEELKTLEASYHKAIINTVGKDAYDMYGLDALNPTKLLQDNEVAINLANKFNSNQQFRFKVSDLNNYREGFTDTAELIGQEMAWMRNEHSNNDAGKIVDNYLNGLTSKTPYTSIILENSKPNSYVFDDRDSMEVYTNNYAKEHPGASYLDFKSNIVNQEIGKVKEGIKDIANSFEQAGLTRYGALELSITPDLNRLSRLDSKTPVKENREEKTVKQGFTFKREIPSLGKKLEPKTKPNTISREF